MFDPICLESRDYDSAMQQQQYPPVLRHPHKRLVYDLCLAAGYRAHGHLKYSQWKPRGLPESIPSRASEVIVQQGYFDYAPSTNSAWHLNFADPRLFFAYGSGLFAQDEMQVLEHPILSCLREALAAAGRDPMTVDGDGATPVLIQNAERVCFIDTAPSDSAPRGLYGNRFQSASPEAIREALRILPAPALTNLIAIAAPVGQGRYTLAQVTSIMQAAYCGFRAAVLSSPTSAVEIHTGFWGCGAFGGNRPLMVLLQLLAAQLAQVDQLVFHLGSIGEQPAFDEGRTRLNQLLRDDSSVSSVINKITGLGYRWGQSDGN
ncbi:MAG: hypothetical protein JWP89_5583 [Schlesneria sp.]|nr:hypothetical protein [Schlesneria sp.]